MNEVSQKGAKADLSTRLGDLVASVEVERMSPASVQRRVEERARRRRRQRGVCSVVFGMAAVFVVFGALAAGDHGTANRVVTRGPIVPAAPQGSSGEIGSGQGTLPPDSVEASGPTMTSEEMNTPQATTLTTTPPAVQTPSTPETTALSPVTPSETEATVPATTVAPSTEVIHCPTWTGPESASTWPPECGTPLDRVVGPNRGGSSPSASIPTTPPGK